MIEALLKNQSGTPFSRINLAETLSKDLNLPEFKKAVEAVVRAINITNKYSKESQVAKMDESSLANDEEILLHQTMKELALNSESSGRESPHQFLNKLYRLESNITDFFDRVMVMDPDPVMRSNRLALCNLLAQWSSERLDLKEIIFPGD